MRFGLLEKFPERKTLFVNDIDQKGIDLFALEKFMARHKTVVGFPEAEPITNEQLLVLPEGSVATQATVFVPSENVVPEGGVQTTLTDPLLSVAVTV